jgi:phosphatidylglycerol:prolipoprotein diacylglycerol transferase
VALRFGSSASTYPSPRHASPQSTGLLQVARVGCDALAEAEPQALGLTHWFDAARDGEPYTAVVRFAGHRIGLDREPGARDSFVASETVARVMPGSGRVAITARIFDIASGEWSVSATLITRHHSRADVRPSTRLLKPQRASASGKTGFAPVVRVHAPGAHLGAWPALVSVGVGAALTVQSRLAARDHLPVAATLPVSLIAAVAGLLGARIYYLAQQGPRLLVKPRALLNAGMCIQGFVLAAIATSSIGMVVVGLSVGRFLDATAPGLLFGMSIGRFGCFFGGCCAGRPTASRWGLWSSDRRVGTRRVPTQLVESVLAAALGVGALLAGLTGTVEPAGAVFVAAIAAYTFGRQLLLPWRDLPRNTPHGRTLTAAIAVAVVLADVVVAVLA